MSPKVTICPPGKAIGYDPDDPRLSKAAREYRADADGRRRMNDSYDRQHVRDRLYGADTDVDHAPYLPADKELKL